MKYINPEPKLDDKKLQYTNINDSIDYKKFDTIYFAFIDVLGFQKTFDDMHLSGNGESIKKYSEVFKYYFALMNSAQFMRNDGCYAGQTSDSLYFYTTRPDFLWQFIKIFSHFNLYAMSKNVFFRGGIAKGNLYINQNYQFFGDSVINAYLLESKISKNPIILLDDKTFDDLKDYAGNEYLIKDANRRHFIRPFAFLEHEEKLDFIDVSILKKIKPNDIISNIKRNKQLFEYDEKNFNKYIFLLTEFEEKQKTKQNKGE